MMRQLIDGIRYGAKAKGVSVWRFLWDSLTPAELITLGVAVGAWSAGIFYAVCEVLSYV